MLGAKKYLSEILSVCWIVCGFVHITFKTDQTDLNVVFIDALWQAYYILSLFHLNWFTHNKIMSQKNPQANYPMKQLYT